jgi:primosomal protein N' (replication factor Y)
MPPFAYQALLRADHKRLETAMDFLRQAQDMARALVADMGLPEAEFITVCDPVALTVVRVAKVERAQLLVESSSRAALQSLLANWLVQLSAMRTPVRWFLDVDPTEI